LAGENLFLRKQLALYLESQVKPRRASNATRLTLVVVYRQYSGCYQNSNPHVRFAALEAQDVAAFRRY
jgi:hypothetical protein